MNFATFQASGQDKNSTADTKVTPLTRSCSMTP